MKKWIALLLAGVMFFSSAWIPGAGSSSVYAADDEVEVIYSDVEYDVNPLYADIIDEASLDLEPSESGISMYTEPVYETDINVLKEAMRQAMLYRCERVTLYYETMDISGLGEGWLTDWLDNYAFAHTGDPIGGDYLQWHYKGAQASYGGYKLSDGRYQLEFRFTFEYYTTTEQEEIVAAVSDEVLAKLGIKAEMSDYEKTKLIYDYVCDTVTYDYDNLYDNSYFLKFSAYAALINKTAVCQGYANLLYRLLNAVGVDARVISGLGNGGPHAWNLIGIDGVYYYADATWDAGRNNYNYFLRGTTDFGDHTPQSQFVDDYLIAGSMYVESLHCDHNYGDWEVFKAPTCSATGVIAQSCSKCGHMVTQTTEKDAENHSFDTVITKATTSKAGSISEVCKDCDLVNASTPIAKIASVELSETSYVYDGSAKKPSVTVKDEDGKTLENRTDYTVSYASGRTNVGTYDVTVTFCGNYSGSVVLSFTIYPVAPGSVTAKLTGHNDATVTWDAVAGADGYHIYYKKSSAASYNTTYKTTTGTSCKYSNLAANTLYNIKVVPYVLVGGVEMESANSQVTTLQTLRNLAAPSKVTLQLTGHNDVKVSWSKVSNASGYYVYYKKASASSYSSYKTTTGTSLTFTNLTASTKYTFKVIPYGVSNGSKIKSDNYSTNSITTLKNLAAPSKVTLQLTGHNDVKVSWSKVSNASGYYVYYKKASASSYSSYKTTTGTSLTFTNLTASTKYTFKVIPYGVSGSTKVKSDNYKTSSITTLKDLSAPSKLTLTVKSKSSIKASWSKVSGAKGYYVYYKKSSASSYSLYKTTTGTSLTLTGLSKNTKYTIKIVPYGVSGSTKVKSDHYITKSATTLKK